MANLDGQTLSNHSSRDDVIPPLDMSHLPRSAVQSRPQYEGGYHHNVYRDSIHSKRSSHRGSRNLNPYMMEDHLRRASLRDNPEGIPADDDGDLNKLVDDLQSDCGEEAEDDEEEDDDDPGAEKAIEPRILETNHTLGLTEDEVTQRRKKYGENKLDEQKKNHIMKFLSFFVGPIQFVMEAAAILAAGLRDWIDFGIIIGLLLLNAAVGFFQEYQAGSVVEALKKNLALATKVMRNGRLVELDVQWVVPGDIVVLEEVDMFKLAQ